MMYHVVHNKNLLFKFWKIILRYVFEFTHYVVSTLYVVYFTYVYD